MASGHRGGFGPAQQTWLLCFNQAEKSKAPQSSADASDPLKPGFSSSKPRSSSPKPNSSSSKPQTRLSPQHQHPHTSRLDPTCCNPSTLQCPGRSKSSVRGGPKHSFCAGGNTSSAVSREERGTALSAAFGNFNFVFRSKAQQTPAERSRAATESRRILTWKGLIAL